MPMIDGIEQRLRAVAKTAGNDFHQARSGCPYCDDFRDYATPAAVLALLDTIAELRRELERAELERDTQRDITDREAARAEIAERERGALHEALLECRALTKQQDTDPTPTGQED